MNTEIIGWLSTAVVGAVWLLREWRAWRKQRYDILEQFAQSMIQREKDLTLRVQRLEEEVTRLRLLLVEHNINPDGEHD